MLKYAKIINKETKQCDVGLGTNVAFYQSLGMTMQDVAEAYNGMWYLVGYAPEAPEPSYTKKREAEYPPMADYLDAQVKLNSGNAELIAEGQAQLDAYIAACLAVKEKYPKPESAGE